MNPSAEFLGIQLENSILCKHRKIAGKVETIFCEAAPIRLTEVTRLKRLGPEPIAFDRCPECRQFVCNCLWKKHFHVRPNDKYYSGTCNPANIPKSKGRPKINLTPYKIRKRNANYGNTFSTAMAWVKKPVQKMDFSGDDLNSRRESRHALATKTVQMTHESSNMGTLQAFNCILQTTGKIDADNYIELRQNYFEEHHKPLADEKHYQNQNNVKIVQKIKTSTLPKTQKPNNRMLETHPATKYIKDIKENSTPRPDISMQLNMMMSVEPVQIAPQSPVAMATIEEAKPMPKMANYMHRVTELMQTRNLFGDQAQCSCQSPLVSSNARTSHLKRTTEVFSYPSRYSSSKTSDSKDCRHNKASEFLAQYKEAGVSRPARTIESLENIEHKAKQQQPFTNPSSKVATTEKSPGFYGDPRIYEQAMHQTGNNFNTANGSNAMPRDTRYVRGENIIMKHIAVQTEESSFSIPKLIQAQTASKCDLVVATEADADKAKENNKTVSFRVTPVESSFKRIENNFGEALVQELVCELTDEVAKCNSRVKKLAALFESRSKINSSINNRNPSLSLPNVRHSKKEFESNIENAKSFCSAAEFSKDIKHQTQEQKTIENESEVITQEPSAVDETETKQENIKQENFKKQIDTNNIDDDDFNIDVNDFNSSSSSSLSKSSSQISITTVVLNPFKKEEEIIKSKDYDAFDSYELEVP